MQHIITATPKPVEMNIEQEMAKGYFRNNAHKALVNIIFTGNWILERMKKVLEQEDITHQQYNILRILRGSDNPMSTQQIRSKMLDKMSDTSRIVERMIKKGLVNKLPCNHDKRLVDITITPEGKQLIDRLSSKDGWVDSIIDKLNGKEIDILNTLLDKARIEE